MNYLFMICGLIIFASGFYSHYYIVPSRNITLKSQRVKVSLRNYAKDPLVPSVEIIDDWSDGTWLHRKYVPIVNSEGKADLMLLNESKGRYK